MAPSIHQWPRGPRSSFNLSSECGVYALFLREGCKLAGISPGELGLIYVGMAANRAGLSGRCHFNAKTRNHSPRKSFAVLLMDHLDLTPILIPKPNSADTWGLDAASEARLTKWMHSNLELAFETCDDPNMRETELVSHYAPPLNLTKCAQTDQHRRISKARSDVLAALQHNGSGSAGNNQAELAFPRLRRSFATTGKKPIGKFNETLDSEPIGSEIDTAEAIAARYSLNPKSYRQRLRNTVIWYRKPQDWTFAVGSQEWKDMIRVAEQMTR